MRNKILSTIFLFCLLFAIVFTSAVYAYCPFDDTVANDIIVKSDWEYDAINHWKPTGGWGGNAMYGPHVFTSNIMTDNGVMCVCGDCGAMLPRWESNDTHHWKMSDGKEILKSQHHFITDINDKIQYCVDCGVTASIVWQSSDSHHWLAYSGWGGMHDYDYHVVDEGVALPDGTIQYTCIVCGAITYENWTLIKIKEQNWGRFPSIERGDNFEYTRTDSNGNIIEFKFDGTELFYSYPVYIQDADDLVYSHHNKYIYLQVELPHIKVTAFVSEHPDGQYEKREIYIPEYAYYISDKFFYSQSDCDVYASKDFDYDADNDAFFAEDYEIRGVVYDKVVLKFKNRKISYIYKVLDGVEYIETFSYDTADITPPVISIDKQNTQ